MQRTKHNKHSVEKTGEASKKWKGRTFVAGLVFLLVVSYAYLDRYAFNNEDKEAGYKTHPQSKNLKKEQGFIKEGELTFIDQKTKKNIKTIDIEIAHTRKERETGLMYRSSMPETAGMLFRFDRFKPAFFWMRNTYIPLDMIFVDKNMRIVKIYQNAEPLSDKPIPVHKETMYTIEVNAGFCEQYGIAIGDHVVFHQF